MMKTKLAKAVALVVALQAGALHALGLGDISVASSVNERFVAEIPIANARGLDKSQILVSLASSSDFTRASIERSYYLSRLDFDVDTSGANKVLRISTNDVILEPYLNFLLEVRWPNGRLLKEYMVLLDLPAYTAAPAKVIDAPTPNSRDRGDNTSTKASNAPQPSKTLPSRSRATNASVIRERAPVDASAVASGSYTVQANQTLWDIAKASRASGETITQAMNRVYQANPTAFVNGDINRLVKGAVLRIPTAVTQSSKQSAIVNTYVAPSDSSLAALKDADQALSDSAAEQPATSQQDNGLLTLSAADLNQNQNDQTASSAVARGTKEASGMETTVKNTQATQSQYSSTADIAQLENDLARSFESLDRAKLENADLEQRVEGIQQQFTDLERLITLKDQELAALRDSLTQGVEASDIDLALVTAAPTNAAATPANTNQAGSVVDKLASALSLTGTAFLLVIGTVVALLVGLGWWLLSRKEDDEYEASIFEPAEPLREAEPKVEVKSESLATATTEEVFAANEQAPALDTVTAEQVSSDLLDDAAVDDTSFESTSFENTSFENTVLDEMQFESAVLEHEAEPLLGNAEPVADDLLVEELTDLNAPLEFDVSAEVDPLADETLDELDKLGLSLDLDAEVNVISEEADKDVGLQLAYDADATDSLTPVDVNSARSTDERDESNFVSEVGTKLDLARAYIDMGDFDGAREILDEVLQEGSDLQRTQATEMLTRIA